MQLKLKLKKLNRKVLIISAALLVILLVGLLLFIGPLKKNNPIKPQTYTLAVDIGKTTDGDNLDELTDFSVSKQGYAAVVKSNLNFYNNQGKLLWSKKTPSTGASYSHVVTDDSGVIAVRNSYPAYSQSNSSGDSASQLLSSLQALNNSLTPTPTLIKYNFAGKEIWSTNLPDGIFIKSMAFSSLEGIYATATFRSSVNISNHTYTSFGQDNVLLLFIDNQTGAIEGTTQVGSTGDDSAMYILPTSSTIAGLEIGGSDTQVVDSANLNAKLNSNKGDYLGEFDPQTSANGDSSPYEFFRSEPNMLAYADNKNYEQQVITTNNPAELYVLTGGPDSSVQQPGSSGTSSINNVAIQTLDSNGNLISSYPLTNLVQGSSPDTNTAFLINTNKSKVYVVASGDIYTYNLSNLKPISNYSIPRFQPFKTFEYNNEIFLAGYQYPNVAQGQSVNYTDMQIYRIN